MGNTPENQRRVQAIVHKTDLIPILTALTQYAKRRIYFWSSYYGRTFPTSKIPDDFGVEAVEDTFLGIRNWCPPENKDEILEDLKGFLMDVVDSKVRNWILRKEGLNAVIDDELTYCAPDAGINLVETFAWLEPFLKEDAELVPILRLYAEGIDKPQSVAECLGISVQTVHNRHKRLERRLKDVLNSRDGE